MEGPVYMAFKKDDDAALVPARDGTTFIIETTADMTAIDPRFVVHDTSGGADAPPPPASELLLQNAVATNASVAVVYALFGMHAIVMGVAELIGISIYVWVQNVNVLLALVITACVLFPTSYLCMIVLRNHHRIGTIAALASWVTSLAFLIGSVSGVTGDVAPLLLLMMLWLQGVVVVGYTRYAPDAINVIHALLAMCVVTFVFWGICIFTFLVEHAWLGPIITLVVALVCALYHAYQLRRVKHEDRYNLSDKDALLAIVQLYGDPVLIACQAAVSGYETAVARISTMNA